MKNFKHLKYMQFVKRNIDYTNGETKKNLFEINFV